MEKKKPMTRSQNMARVKKQKYKARGFIEKNFCSIRDLDID